MRRIAFLVLLIVATLGPRAVVGVRADETCAAGCVGDLRSCLHGGGDAKLVCRAECKADRGRNFGGCLRQCRAVYRAGRTACRSDALDCLSGCADATAGAGEPSERPNPACPGGCGAALGQCLRAASATIPGCLGRCPNGRDRQACVEGCMVIAKGGAASCKADHDTCLAGCGGVTPTTSTTFPPPPPCAEAGAPACGGSCPEPALTCAQIEPGVCGCVGGSPSAAFVRP